MEKEKSRLIITVIGRDRVGIIASLSAILAQNNINILDISQTILQGFFTMVMVVDVEECQADMSEIKEKLVDEGKAMDMVVTVQHEDVFRFMHRI
jgi:ACT domain-containing protein